MKNFIDKMFAITSEPPPKANVFEVGPHIDEDDLCRQRPYFLVPLFDLNSSSEESDPFEDVRMTLLRKIPQHVTKEAKEITDIYIISHGWHRNFYAAVSAYDRLISRFCILMHRKRLQVKPPWNPLFIALHWNSDPGKDGWVSRSGGSSKESFLSKAAKTFDQSPTKNFKDLFEDIYFFLNWVATAPDLKLREDPNFTKQAQPLTRDLKTFPLKDAPGATLDEKIAAVWTCYYEADAVKLRLNQDANPARFNTPIESVMTLFKFIFAVVGLAFLLSHLSALNKYLLLPIKAVFLPLFVFWQWVYRGILHIASVTVAPSPPWFGHWLIIILLLGVVSILLPWLVLSVIAHTNRHETNKTHKTSWLAVAAWFPMQLMLAIPLVIWALITYTLGGVFQKFLTRKTLFSEHIDESSKSKTSHRLSRLARFPIRLLESVTPPDSSIRGLSGQIDNQLAFWEMQQLGTKAGGKAAEFMQDLFEPSPEKSDFLELTENARIHCIGHSFGALVIANLIRQYSHTMPQYQPEDIRSKPIHSVSLIQGALASNWFEGETTLCTKGVASVIGNIYSRYDTANSLYYPLTNYARCSAGFRGLLPLGGNPGGGSIPVGPRMLAKLLKDSAAVLAEPTETTSRPHYLNIDVSHLICDGPIATGGGHGDIFKDEVVEIIWGITQW